MENGEDCIVFNDEKEIEFITGIFSFSVKINPSRDFWQRMKNYFALQSRSVVINEPQTSIIMCVSWNTRRISFPP